MKKKYITCFKCGSSIMQLAYTGVSTVTKKHMLTMECAKCGWEIGGFHITHDEVEMFKVGYEIALPARNKKIKEVN